MQRSEVPELESPPARAQRRPPRARGARAAFPPSVQPARRANKEQRTKDRAASARPPAHAAPARGGGGEGGGAAGRRAPVLAREALCRIPALAREVTEYLEDAGSVSIGELATKHSFPVAFVEKMVTTRLASGKLQASRRRDKLYSKQFASDIERRILGALTAITRPTPLQSLVQRFDFLERSVVVDAAKKLCTSGRVRGTVSDDEFFPEIFGRIQRDACLGFFQSNGWMPKARALQLEVTRLAPLLAEKLGSDAVLDLPSCVIPTSAFEIMRPHVEEVVTAAAGATSSSSPRPPSIDARARIKLESSYLN